MENGGAVSWFKMDVERNDLGLSFKALLEEDADWFVDNNSNPHQSVFGTVQSQLEINGIAFPEDPNQETILSRQMDSSSSSYYPVFNLDPSQAFLTNKAYSSPSSSLGPFDVGFGLGCGTIGFLSAPSHNSVPGALPSLGDFPLKDRMGVLDFVAESQFPATHLIPLVGNASFDPWGLQGFDGSAGNALFQDRPKALRPPEIFPMPAFRQNPTLSSAADNGGYFERRDCEEDWEKKMAKINEGNGVDYGSINASALNYDSDEAARSSYGNTEDANEVKGDHQSNARSSGEEKKGKKKGLPAKNLMAERRRRKKLNDRLYMLRSVIPKISKMDRASILGDAIDYLKELLQRINGLHNELESSLSTDLIPASSTMYPRTPTPLNLPNHIQEDLDLSSLPSPNGQPAKVEVRATGGQAIKIHMLCARRPGLLLSTMRLLDRLGLDIQQAVISCFNEFSFEVFQAKQCSGGPDILPEEIKALLLQSVGLNDHMPLNI